MKKNTILSLMAMAFSLFAALTLTACGDEEEETGGGGGNSSTSIEGTWVMTNDTFKEGIDLYEYYSTTLILNKDNTYKIKMLIDQYSTEKNEWGEAIPEADDVKPRNGYYYMFIEKQNLSGTYTVRGNDITFIVQEDEFYDRWEGVWSTNRSEEPYNLTDEPLKFSLKGNKLTISSTIEGEQFVSGPFPFFGEYTRK